MKNLGSRFAGSICVGLIFVCLPSVTGCNPAGGTAPTGGGSRADTSREAKKLLDQLSETYQQATSYADAGRLTMSFLLEGKEQKDEFDYSTTFVRPNKLRLHCYGTAVVSDGKTLNVSVRDLPGQVLSIEAPSKLDELTLSSDPVMAYALSEGGPAGAPIIPSLLTNDTLFKEMLKEAKPPVLLEPARIDDQLCDRVEVEFSTPAVKSDTKADPKAKDETPAMAGRLVFHIDRKLKTLRRLELPVHPKIMEQIKESGGSEAKLVAEFTGVRLNQGVKDEAFAFEMPPSATAVKRFVQAFPPEPPSDLLGKRVGDFTFVGAKGEKITRDSLAGKVTVFDFWFSACEPCRQTLPLLQQVYDRYKANDKVAFYAVNVADDGASFADLEKTLKTWDCEAPIARDREQQADKVFRQTGMPCLMVLGADGRLQYFEAGMNPNLPVELPAALDRILKGEDTFDDVQKKYEIARKDYLERLRLAANGDAGPRDAPKVEIAARTEPAKLKLNKVWACADLKGPVGNILVVPDETGTTKLFVNEGFRSVAEFDTDGKLVAKHDLKIPDNQVISFFRTAVDATGRRYYVVFSSAMPQFHCYDDKWRRLFSYPEGEQAAIADVEIGDLDGQGKPTLQVGYWDNVGLQGVSLEGKKLWGNKAVQNPLHLVNAGKKESGERNCWAVNGSETIFPLDHMGKLGTPVNIPNRAIEWLEAADLAGDGTLKYCAISAHIPDATVVMGIDEAGHELWSYRLTKGISQQPVERIVTGKLNGQGVWLVAGPDGSLHFLSAEGELLDKFNYGADIGGLALIESNGQTLLLVSSAAGLEAWEVK